MQIVAGLSLNNLNPRVWKPDSPYYLPDLKAVMVSYADLHRLPARRKRAMDVGLHAELGIPMGLKIYLDNGAFYFIGRKEESLEEEYTEFVAKAKPDWYPIPQDFIPTPQMTVEEQALCYKRTMRVNRQYEHNGFTPVVHISPYLKKYTRSIKENKRLSCKPTVALGAIVPNLLRTSKAIPYLRVIAGLRHTRRAFHGKQLHVFGIGGTATLHIAALFGMDSVDSSGWRNRAARGIIQLPGSGDRVVADLGKWRGREPNEQEWKVLKNCACPACREFGVDGLKRSLSEGFQNRATHNLWTLLQEAQWIEEHIAEGTYLEEYKAHLYNSTYRRLIDQIASLQLRARRLREG